MKQFTINSIERIEAVESTEEAPGSSAMYKVSLTAALYEEVQPEYDDNGDIIESERSPSIEATTIVYIAPLDMDSVSECLSSLAYTAISSLGLDGAFMDDVLPYVENDDALFEEGAVITLL